MMKISINKTDDGVFECLFGDSNIDLSLDDIQNLHAQLTAILRPETVSEKQSRHSDFFSQLARANDSGIQSLLRVAEHNDIVILLKTSEDDVDLKKKLYSNMTENAIKMFVEDMTFLMREGVADYKFDEAMTRLIKLVDQLVKKGTLVLETS